MAFWSLFTSLRSHYRVQVQRVCPDVIGTLSLSSSPSAQYSVVVIFYTSSVFFFNVPFGSGSMRGDKGVRILKKTPLKLPEALKLPEVYHAAFGDIFDFDAGFNGGGHRVQSP